jgi:hypothetical protein
MLAFFQQNTKCGNLSLICGRISKEEHASQDMFYFLKMFRVVCLFSWGDCPPRGIIMVELFAMVPFSRINAYAKWVLWFIFNLQIKKIGSATHIHTQLL